MGMAISMSFPQEDRFLVRENNGTGIFSKHAVTTVDNGARRAFVLDINQDGYQDILVASVSDQTISWYENNGSGGLAQRIVTSS